MSDWYGLSKAGGQLQITATQMADWAFANDQQITIGWSDHKEFTDSEVSDERLKGARFARALRGKPSETAERVGWLDLAEMLKGAGL